jgi:very-short-patch-repair endonuclease
MNPEIKTPYYIIKLAKDMRDNSTPSEKLLWSRLRKKQLGIKFRQQHPIYRYILDFYCSKKRLAIEIDGEVHDGMEEYDKYRDEFLKSMDITTIRVKSDDVIRDIDGIVKKINEYIYSVS